MLGSVTTPVTSLDPKFWWYIIWRFGSLERQSWSSLAIGIAVRIHSKIFFVYWKSLYELNLQFILKCVASFIITAQYFSYFFVFSYHQATINLHILPIRSCDWTLEYQFLCAQHKPVPTSLRNQPLGQHRRTWPLPSCSGYNNTPIPPYACMACTDTICLYHRYGSRYVGQ
jgi:hypothetical protein